MPNHPCSGHVATCDHCYRCEVLRECCLTVPTRADTQAAQYQEDLERVLEGIAADQADQPSLSELIQAEASDSLIRRLLAGAPAPEAVPAPLVRKSPQRTQQPAPALHRTAQPALPPANASPSDLLTQQQSTYRKDNT